MLRLILCLILLLPVVANSNQQNAAPNLHFQEGQKALEKYDSETALEKFKLAIQEYEQQNNRQGLANAIRGLGKAHAGMDNFPEALDAFNKALKLDQELGNKNDIADDITYIAMAHQRQGSYDQALTLSEKALALQTELKNPQKVVKTLENIGSIHYRRAEYDKAIDFFSRALSMAQEMSNQKLILSVLSNMVPVYWIQRDYRKALEISELAEKLAEEIGDLKNVAIILGNRSIIYSDQGDYAMGLQIAEKCLAIFQQIGSLQHQGNVYLNMGTLNQELGNYGKAQEAYQKSIALAEKIEDKGLLCVVFSNMAELKIELGDSEQALNYVQRSLDLSKEIGEKASTASSLKILGIIYTSTANYKAALKSFNEMLHLSMEMKDQNRTAESHYYIGVTQAKMRNYDQALENYEKALASWEAINVKPDIGKCYLMIGAAYYSKTNRGEAATAFDKSIALLKEMGRQDLLWRAMYNKALLDRDGGKIPEAISQMKEAVDVLDLVRGEVFLPEQKWMFLENKLDAYEDLIGLLTEKQEVEQAFNYVQRSKARAFLDLLSESRIDPQINLNSGQYQEKKRLAADLMNVNRSIQEQYEQDKIDRPAVSKLEKERTRLEDLYSNLMFEIRKENPHYASLQYPQPLKLSDAQSLVNKDTVLMEYFVGRKNSFCFVITSDESKAFVLPAESELNDEIRLYMDAIQKPDPVWEASHGSYREYAKLARSLYNKLLEPAGSRLQGKSRIIIAPDGMLNYLPFESLLTSGNDLKQIVFSKLSYLGMKYELQYVPSISVLSAIGQLRQTSGEDSRKKLIAFANPSIGSSETKTGNNNSEFTRTVRDWSLSLKPLPYAQVEVEEISKLYPKGMTTLMIGKDASEKNVKQMNLQDYRIVHFASHGLIDEERPQFSSLILNAEDDEDGYLTMREVFDLKLNADLVVLSACKTGLGQRIRGEGVTGLSRSFFGAGASSVLVSLWNVYDASTSNFMASFYRSMENGKLNKSAALKEARASMIRSKKFSHPYYWAPFILIGNS